MTDATAAPLDADAIVGSIRDRLRRVPNLRDVCKRADLSWSTVQSIMYGAKASHGIHTLEAVDRMLRDLDH